MVYEIAASDSVWFIAVRAIAVQSIAAGFEMAPGVFDISCVCFGCHDGAERCK